MSGLGAEMTGGRNRGYISKGLKENEYYPQHI